MKTLFAGIKKNIVKIFTNVAIKDKGDILEATRFEIFREALRFRSMTIIGPFYK